MSVEALPSRPAGADAASIVVSHVLVAPIESTVSVTANVRVDSGSVQAISPWLTSASASVSLRLKAQHIDGTTICTREIELAAVSETATMAVPTNFYVLSCTGNRMPLIPDSRIISTVTLIGRTSATGTASAHAQARVRLNGVDTRNCTEPYAFFDGQGLCVRALSSAVGASTQLARCTAHAGAKWAWDPASGLMRNLQTGLCLSVDPFASPIGRYTPVSMRMCEGSSGSLRQRWTPP